MTTLRPDCMDEREFALWDAANRYTSHPAKKPCADCPAAFSEEMRAEGRCNVPVFVTRWGHRVTPERREKLAGYARAFRARRKERAA